MEAAQEAEGEVDEDSNQEKNEEGGCFSECDHDAVEGDCQSYEIGVEYA